MNLENFSLLSALNNLGETAPLAMEIYADDFQEQIVEFDDEWKQYNPRKPDIKREGLSLTSLDGSLSGIPDLDSILEYNRENNTKYSELDFTKKTIAYEKLKCLHPLLDIFGDNLCRTHILRFQKGGFFPPHRDNYKNATCFRIVVPLTETDESYMFVLNNKRLCLRPFKPYFVNTCLEHALFAFNNNTHFLVASVILKEETVKLVFKNLATR